MIMKVGINC